MAERGAEMAVETAIHSVSRALDDGQSDYCAMLWEAALTARESVLTEAQTHGADPREFASTLLVALAGPSGGGVLQIGDGVTVVREGGDEWCWVFWPQHGEYANTTYFLTDDDATEHLQAETFWGAITDIALMTDGLERIALHFVTRSVHKPFFDGMFQPLLNADGANEINHLSVLLERFLSSEPIQCRTDDDVSLILATCREHDHQE